MRSETGALLTKISAIIDIIIAVIVLLGAIGIAIGITFIDEIPNWLSGVGIVVAIIIFIFGLLVWRAAEMMKDSRTVRSGAIWAIVLGIITISTISGILALIGGIIALVEAGR